MDTNSRQASAAMSATAFVRWARIGRTQAFNEITAGRFIAAKVSARKLVTMEEAQRWISTLPVCATRPAKGH